MAVTQISKTGLFDPYIRDKASLQTIISLATLGGGTAAERETAKNMLARGCGRPGADFKWYGTTSNNDALAEAMDLTDEGVTFPAATVRKIRMAMRSSNDADTFVQVIEQDVWGNDGTTPVLGDAKLVDAYMIDGGVYKKMGIVHLQTDEAAAEKTDGANSSGVAAGTVSSAVSAITFPPSRLFRVLGAHYSPDEYTSAIDDAGMIILQDVEGEAANGTCDMVFVAIDDGTEGGAAINAGQVDVSLELWPLAQIELVLNSTAVEVHIRTTLSDVFRHDFEVYIGAAEGNPLGA